MASSSSSWLLLLLLSMSFYFSECFVFEGHMNGFPQTKRNLADSSCGPLNCMKGVCSMSLSLPFYQCTCDKGWQSPGNLSWIPCVLPNCSIDLGCGNANDTSSTPPASPISLNTSSFNLCSLPICGNGQCVASSNASLVYECKCSTGSTNLFNTPNGYCVPSCALGGDCSNLNLSLGGSPPPPPSGSLNSSQGTSSSPSSSIQSIPSGGIRQTDVNHLIILCGFLIVLMGLRF